MAADKLIRDLDNVLGKARNRIYRIGIELEGGWKKLPANSTNAIVHDGSVIIPESFLPRTAAEGVLDLRTLQYLQQRGTAPRRNPEIMTGEIPSDPMEVIKMPIWMKQFYPHFVNETCGMHVHMSFQSALHYMRLMVPEYQDTVIHYMSLFAKEEKLASDHPIWDRLAGKSEYCQHIFDPDRQARKTRKEFNHHDPAGHRYTVINYCYGTKGTMECRLLPMMKDSAQGIRAIQKLLDVTNAFLINRGREEKLRGEVIVDPSDEYREEQHVRL